MTPERRRSVIRAMRAIAAVGSAVVLVCCALVAVVPVYAAVAGTLACALVAAAAFYGAFEGFDEALRRGPGPRSR